jgi:hypothetical protein
MDSTPAEPYIKGSIGMQWQFGISLKVTIWERTLDSRTASYAVQLSPRARVRFIGLLGCTVHGNWRTWGRSIPAPLCMDLYKPGAGRSRGDILANPVRGSIHVTLISDCDLESFTVLCSGQHIYITCIACRLVELINLHIHNLVEVLLWAITLWQRPRISWKKLASARLLEEHPAAASRKSPTRGFAGYYTVS